MEKLRVLITAGGTSEPIDSVRRITNTSTGRLGSLLSAEFMRRGAAVTYITAPYAAPPAEGCEVIRICTAGELYDTMSRLLSERRFDVIVHAMAVSDYTVAAVTSLDEMYSAFVSAYSAGGGAEEWKNSLLTGSAEGKLPSNIDGAALVLRPTRKVIGMIRGLQPDAVLVGFKLLAGAEEAELERRAAALLEQNGCDYIVANDITGINGDRHAAAILSRDGVLCRPSDKQGIAAAVAELAAEKRRAI